MATVIVKTPIDDETPDNWGWRINIGDKHIDVPRDQPEFEIELPDRAVRFHARKRLYRAPSDPNKLKSNPRRVNR